MDRDDIIGHLIDIKTTVADTNARLTNVERVLTGNGDEGLVTRVSKLEASKNKLWGGFSVVTAFGAMMEYLHYLWRKH